MIAYRYAFATAAVLQATTSPAFAGIFDVDVDATATAGLDPETRELLLALAKKLDEHPERWRATIEELGAESRKTLAAATGSLLEVQFRTAQTATAVSQCTPDAIGRRISGGVKGVLALATGGIAKPSPPIVCGWDESVVRLGDTVTAFGIDLNVSYNCAIVDGFGKHLADCKVLHPTPFTVAVDTRPAANAELVCQNSPRIHLTPDGFSSDETAVNDLLVECIDYVFYRPTTCTAQAVWAGGEGQSPQQQRRADLLALNRCINDPEKRLPRTPSTARYPDGEPDWSLVPGQRDRVIFRPPQNPGGNEQLRDNGFLYWVECECDAH